MTCSATEISDLGDSNAVIHSMVVMDLCHMFLYSVTSLALSVEGKQQISSSTVSITAVNFSTCRSTLQSAFLPATSFQTVTVLWDWP